MRSVRPSAARTYIANAAAAVRRQMRWEANGEPLFARGEALQGWTAGAGARYGSRMTWRETFILVAIAALLSAAITIAIRIVIENASF